MVEGDRYPVQALYRQERPTPDELREHQALPPQVLLPLLLRPLLRRPRGPTPRIQRYSTRLPEKPQSRL